MGNAVKYFKVEINNLPEKPFFRGLTKAIAFESYFLH